VDPDETSRPSASSIDQTERLETRRRVWYSLYVLDRLIALQLGRPPAIYDSDCHVSKPSRMEVNEWELHQASVPSPEGPSTGDYFLHVIEFSVIIGRVLRELYQPNQSMATKVRVTKDCDEQLLAWKHSLPRFLRFDVGHAFDKSVTFRRQVSVFANPQSCRCSRAVTNDCLKRNMLAMKFYHLRALEHRLYLCLPRPKGHQGTLFGVPDAQLDHYESICISSAQSTARLLHHVIDEKALVHDFPWWQMISCLMCAGSILIVAKAFVQPNDNTGRGMIEGPSTHDMLEDDAETCLQVFDALSPKSDGARIARDMMRKLQLHSSGGGLSNRGNAYYEYQTDTARAIASAHQVRTIPEQSHGPSASLVRGHQPHFHVDQQERRRDSFDLRSGLVHSSSMPSQAVQQPLSTNSSVAPVANGPVPAINMPYSSEAVSLGSTGVESTRYMDAYYQAQDLWPLELSDSLAWSAQFFNDVVPGQQALAGDGVGP